MTSHPHTSRLVLAFVMALPHASSAQNEPATRQSRLGPYLTVVTPPPAQRFETTDTTRQALALLDAVELIHRTNSQRLGIVSYLAELEEGLAAGSSEQLTSVAYQARLAAIDSMTDDGRFLQQATVTTEKGSFRYHAASDGVVGDRREPDTSLTLNLPADRVFIPVARPWDYIRVGGPAPLINALRSGVATALDVETTIHPTFGKVARMTLLYQSGLPVRAERVVLAVQQGGWTVEYTSWTDDEQTHLERRLDRLKLQPIERAGAVAFLPVNGAVRYFTIADGRPVEFVRRMEIDPESIAFPDARPGLFRLVPQPGERFVDAPSGIQSVGTTPTQPLPNADTRSPVTRNLRKAGLIALLSTCVLAAVVLLSWKRRWTGHANRPSKSSP